METIIEKHRAKIVRLFFLSVLIPTIIVIVKTVISVTALQANEVLTFHSFMYECRFAIASIILVIITGILSFVDVYPNEDNEAN